jgi:hypothetical protein
MPRLLCFTNCQTCVSGELIPQDVYFSPEQGIIVPNYYYRTEGVERIDLGGAIVAPGFLDLQTNGLQGVHFTQLGRKDDEEKLLQVARSEARCGVTAFWCTVPTVEEGSWKKVRLLCLMYLASAAPLSVYFYGFTGCGKQFHRTMNWALRRPGRSISIGCNILGRDAPYIESFFSYVVKVLRNPCIYSLHIL